MPTEISPPEAPNPAAGEMWSGAPNVVLDGERYAIGWQHFPAEAGGPAYVTIRRGLLGGRRVVRRYPLTPAGWTRAWAAFAQLDPVMAEKTRLVLGNYYAARPPESSVASRLQDAEVVGLVPGLILCAITPPAETFALGEAYELRFGKDSVQIARSRSAATTAEYRYADVAAMQVTGFERVPAAPAFASFFFRLPTAVDDSSYRIYVRIQTCDRALDFSHSAMSPAHFAPWLDRLNRAIRQLALSAAADKDQHKAEWLSAELSRLAGKLARGTLTTSDLALLKNRISGGF